MNANPNQRSRRIALTAGLGAVAALTVLGLGHPPPSGPVLAGSGDAPSNTTYRQPAVAGMNMGATATWAPPATTEEITKAVPAIKAAG